jgi:hypothetical protein
MTAVDVSIHREEVSMSTANLNVWITELGHPCQIVDNQHHWFVHILRCNGEVLTWCDRRYTNLEARCGHLEVEVPPGCYVVCATWSPGKSAQFLGNHLTHCAIVQVKCGDHACVNLFTPTLHQCGTHFAAGVRDAVQAGHLPQNALRAAEAVQAAVRTLLEFVPADPFGDRTAHLAAGERPRPTTGPS